MQVVKKRAGAPPADPCVREVISLYLQLEAKVDTRRSKEAWEERQRLLGLFADFCGKRPISELTKGTLKAWIEGNPALKSDWTRGRWCRTIQRAFNWAANDMELIGRNPFRGVRYRKGKRGRPLTDEEFETLLANARPEVAPILQFCRWTGCRPAEMSAAKWTDIHGDLLKGEAFIILADHKTSHREDAAPRVIAMPPVIIELLKQIVKARGHLDGPIFLNSKGKPWTCNALCDAFRSLREKCGFAADCKLYSCRHAYGTQAIVNGVALKDLADLMGHASVAMTQTYIHTAAMHGRLCRLAAQAAAQAPKATPEDDAPAAIC